MHNIIQFKKVCLSALILALGIFCIAPAQASTAGKGRYIEPEVDESDSKENEYKYENNPYIDQKYLKREVPQTDKLASNIPLIRFVKREGELLIPANGNCLFTSILLGYLIPVIEDIKEFKIRCLNAIGKKDINTRFDYLWRELKNISQDNYLKLLKSSFFNQVIIKNMRMNIGFNDNQWGGYEEVKLLANQLQVAIQVYIPNSEEKNKTLITSDLVNPDKGNPKETIEIVQDVSAPDENQLNNNNSFQEIMGVFGSIQDQKQPQHFRLKTKIKLPLRKEGNESSAKIDQNRIADQSRIELKEVQYLQLLKKSKQIPPEEYEPLDNQVYSFVKTANSDFTEEKLKTYQKMPPSVTKYLGILTYQLNDKMLTEQGQTSGGELFNDESKSNDGYEDETLMLLCKKVRTYANKYIRGNEFLSLVSSGMNSTESYISRQDWEGAFKETTLLLRKIQPVSIQDTLLYAQQAEKASNFIEGEYVVLLLGATGVGKSTTILYLMGCKMKEIQENKLIHIQADRSNLDQKYQKQVERITSSAQDRSETRYITGVIVDPIDFGVINAKYKRVILCDTPGFSDTSGPEVDIANGTGVIKALQKAKGVTIAFLLNENTLYSNRMQPVIDVIYPVAKMMPRFSDNQSAFSYFFTKVPELKRGKQIHQKFHNLLKLEEQSKIDPFDEAARTILTHIKYATKKKTWIIDPMRSMVDQDSNPATPEAKDILAYLTGKATYIKNPHKVFEPYLSASSAEALNKQLIFHKDIILSAIEEENFSLATYKLNEIKAIKELLQNPNINSSYQDISQQASKLWNILAKKAMYDLKEHIFSNKQLDEKVIDRYQDIYALYHDFDKKMRTAHLLKKSISSELFIIQFKEMLIQLRLKVLINPLHSPKKTTLYLQKLNDIGKLIDPFSPFVEKTKKLLATYFQKMSEKANKLIGDHQFEEVKEILINMHGGLEIQKAMNQKSEGIQGYFENIQDKLLKYSKGIIQTTASILGIEYTSDSSKNVEGSSDQEETEISKNYNHDYTSMLFMYSDDHLALIKDDYTTIQKAYFTFRENRVLPGVAKGIANIYDQFLETNISYIKSCTKEIINSLEANFGSTKPRTGNMIKWVVGLRKIHAIGAKTYREYNLIQQAMSTQLDKTGSNIVSLVRKFFHEKDKVAIEKLAKYVTTCKNSSIISLDEQEELLAPLKSAFNTRLKRIANKAKLIHLSTYRYVDQDFDNLEDILNILHMLDDHKITKMLENVREYHKNILKFITDKVKETVSDIKTSFNTEEEQLVTKIKRLGILEEYVESIKSLEKIEKKFAIKLEKLPDYIANEESLQKGIENLKVKINRTAQDIIISESNNQKVTTELEHEILNLELLRTGCLSFMATLYDKPDELKKQVKLLLTQKGCDFTTLEDLIARLKDKKEEQTNHAIKIKEQRAKKEAQIEGYKNDQEKYKIILQEYSKSKEDAKVTIVKCLNNLAKQSLPSSLLKELESKNLKAANQVMKRLKKDIRFCKENNLDAITNKLDADKASNSIKYLERAQNITWVEGNDDTDDCKSNDDFEVDMGFLLETAYRDLNDYVVTYARNMVQKVGVALKAFYDEVMEESNKPPKKTDLSSPISNFCKFSKEIDSWEKCHKATLFDPYIKGSFIGDCQEKLAYIMNSLETHMRTSNGKKVEYMIIQSQRAIKISRLGKLWGKELSSRANKIYKSYQDEIDAKISNKDIVESIKQRNYTSAFNAINLLLSDIKKSQTNKDELIENTRAFLYNSIAKLIDDIKSKILRLEIDLKGNSGIGSQKSDEALDFSSLMKKLAKARELFFAKDNQNFFLRQYTVKLNNDITALQQQLDQWAKNAYKNIKQNIDSKYFARVLKYLSILDQMNIAIESGGLLSNHKLKECIHNLEEARKSKISNIKNKISGNNIADHDINPFNDLKSNCKELRKANQEEEAKELTLKARDTYLKYLDGIKNGQNIDLEKQKKQIGMANQMLKSMPDELQKELEINYNEAAKKVDENIKKREKQIKEIRDNNTPKKDIEAWAEHKNSPGSTAYFTIKKKIKKRTEEIYNDFQVSLAKHNMLEASREFAKLKLYKNRLDQKNFEDVHSTYREAEIEQVNYGDELLKRLDIPRYNIEQNPQQLYNIASSLKYFTSYNEIFLENNNSLKSIPQ